MRVFNQTRNIVLIKQGRLADNFWLRLRGLLGTSALLEGEGLVLVGEKSIHTLFMQYPIDVVYVNKQYQVIRVDANMVPYRLGPLIWQSAYVVEVPVGVVASTATQVGDYLRFEN
jgi:uncharacterized membrane protein (UPF0127 family)